MPARLQPGETIVASVVDRLLDDDPAEGADRPKSAAQKLRDFRASVLRDVTNLLNTRRRWPSVADRTDLVPSSLDYGIRDVTGVDLSTADARESFRADVEQVLRRYEPRFRSVRVALLVEPDDGRRAVRFRVDAVLHTDPVPEPLAFESVVDPADGSVEVNQ